MCTDEPQSQLECCGGVPALTPCRCCRARPLGSCRCGPVPSQTVSTCKLTRAPTFPRDQSLVDVETKLEESAAAMVGYRIVNLTGLPLMYWAGKKTQHMIQHSTVHNSTVQCRKFSVALHRTPCSVHRLPQVLGGLGNVTVPGPPSAQRPVLPLWVSALVSVLVGVRGVLVGAHLGSENGECKTAAHVVGPDEEQVLQVVPVQKVVTLKDTRQIQARTISLRLQGEWLHITDIVVDKVSQKMDGACLRGCCAICGGSCSGKQGAERDMTHDIVVDKVSRGGCLCIGILCDVWSLMFEKRKR